MQYCGLHPWPCMSRSLDLACQDHLLLLVVKITCCYSTVAFTRDLACWGHLNLDVTFPIFGCRHCRLHRNNFLMCFGQCKKEVAEKKLIWRLDQEYCVSKWCFVFFQVYISRSLTLKIKVMHYMYNTWDSLHESMDLKTIGKIFGITKVQLFELNWIVYTMKNMDQAGLGWCVFNKSTMK